MNSSPARVAAVTGGLMVAGGLLGAIAAAMGAAIAVTITDRALAPFAVVAWAAIIGGVLGAPLLPATSFLLLRRVPLGMSFVGTTLGTAAGGIVGWIAAYTLNLQPIFWPVAAAVIGFFLAVLVLRMRFSSRAEMARPASRVAV